MYLSESIHPSHLVAVYFSESITAAYASATTPKPTHASRASTGSNQNKQRNTHARMQTHHYHHAQVITAGRAPCDELPTYIQMAITYRYMYSCMLVCHPRSALPSLVHRTTSSPRPCHRRTVAAFRPIHSAQLRLRTPVKSIMNAIVVIRLHYAGSRRVLHPPAEGAGEQNTSQIKLFWRHFENGGATF